MTCRAWRDVWLHAADPLRALALGGVALTRYRDDGWLEIDNSDPERALRAVARWVARTGCSVDPTTAVSAPLLSTVSSLAAKLNELNPEGYLGYVLERMADHPMNRIGAVSSGTSPRSSPRYDLQASQAVNAAKAGWLVRWDKPAQRRG